MDVVSVWYISRLAYSRPFCTWWNWVSQYWTLYTFQKWLIIKHFENHYPKQNVEQIISAPKHYIFTPHPLRAPGYCRRPSGRAAGQTSPVNVHNFSRIIFELGKDIYYPKISDEFDGGSASLNMRIMGHLMSRPLLTFLNSFFKVKSPNLVYR